MVTQIISKSPHGITRRLLSRLIVVAFGLNMIVSPVSAQLFPRLPSPGTAVSLSEAFRPPVLLGMKIHPENPLLFDFIVNRGDATLAPDDLKQEMEKLVKYFLAALTLPDHDVWVNLSPYEQDRILPEALGRTEMGKTMLEQDYLLKQLSSSLTNPDDQLGQAYWVSVRNAVQDALGTTQFPINTFNKVWIVPASAQVIEGDGIVLVDEKRLKVMTAEDYTAWRHAAVNQPADGSAMLSPPPGSADDAVDPVVRLSSQVFREVILPHIEQEINHGHNFAPVRQVYNAVILATWYKQALKESLLGRIYANQAKIAGLETVDQEMKQRIYQQYLAAFRKGVYNVIREDPDPVTGMLVPRNYFSGGENFALGVAGSVPLQRGDFKQAVNGRAGYRDHRFSRDPRGARCGRWDRKQQRDFK